VDAINADVNIIGFRGGADTVVPGHRPAVLYLVSRTAAPLPAAAAHGSV